MTHNTATEEGRQKRLEELVAGYVKTGNVPAIIRLIGGSSDDWRNIDSGSHPDEKLNQ